MPPSELDILRVLIEDGPVSWAVLDREGSLLHASRTFQTETGLTPGCTAPEWLRPASTAGSESLERDGRHFEIRRLPVGDAQLVVLEDRSDIVRMEDDVWELQTRLSKVYADLTGKNQELVATAHKLRQREAEISEVNRGLEQRIQEQLQQLERSSKLKRYLSPEVANSILARDQEALSTRKRVLSVFFADIPSFDDLVSEMESEEIIDILCDYHSEMTALVFKHGGTLDKFISARVMGFFGDPVPHEDHAARAVRMGLEMRDLVQTMRHKWFPASEGVDLQVGINTGYATVGNIGCDARMDYTVIGKNVALAASLQQEAKPGQVLMSARTQEAVKKLIEAEQVQVFLRGSSRPLNAFNAIGVKSDKSAMTVELKSSLLHTTATPYQHTLPKKLGPYALLEKLGAGGMGMVYKALDEGLQRTVALKMLQPELTADGRFVARFKHEARALASLNSPYIAQIYYVSDQEVPPFFAMEFIEGPALSRVLSDQGKLPLRRTLELITQVARGLEAAAERGVVHRDIKPDNVMLTLKGQVKLTDFGLAKGGGGGVGLTTPGMILGTPLYMAPEQARGEEADLRSDIYSLGAMFFHMLAGFPPFHGDTAIAVLRKHEEDPLPPHSTLPPAVSQSVYQIIQRMLAKKREERFQDYSSLLEAFDNC